MGGVGWVACQGFLVREACVGVLVGRAGFLLSVPENSRWLGLCAFIVKGAKNTGSVPGWGKRSCKLPKRKKKKKPVPENKILLHALGKVDLKVLK